MGLADLAQKFDEHLQQLRDMVQAGTHEFTYEKVGSARVLTVKEISKSPAVDDSTGGIQSTTESEPQS